MGRKKNIPFAISADEHELYGCPRCGYRSGSVMVSGRGAAVISCGECDKVYVVLAKGLTRSPIGFGDCYPRLQQHPRKGIPKHGKSDKRPEEGGEFFCPRGIGLDDCTCFVCGTHKRDGKKETMLHNIAAFVQCKTAGERVVARFPKGADLDYRPYEPDRVQVKIGACDQHLENLKALYKLCEDGILTEEKINKAIKGEK